MTSATFIHVPISGHARFAFERRQQRGTAHRFFKPLLSWNKRNIDSSARGLHLFSQHGSSPHLQITPHPAMPTVFRSLAKSPGYSAVIVLTLALDIGANTGIFSFFHGILLRALPYEDPERT